MKIQQAKILHLKIPFKIKFSHALKTRTSTNNIIVELKSKNFAGLGESLPRQYVTQETPQTVIKTLENKIIPYFKKHEYKNIKDVITRIQKYLKTIKKNELSAFAAFETAFLNLTSKELNFTLEDIMNQLKIKTTPKQTIEYSAVIGNTNTPLFILKCLEIKRRKFKHLKIKITPNNLHQLKIARKILPKTDIRVDANCSFTNSNINKAITTLSKLNISLFEQPFKPTDKYAELIHHKCQQNNIQIILDESLCQLKDTNKITKNTQGDIANIRISKNGGIINSLLIYKQLQKHNKQSILACLVGETILTKFNIALASQLQTLENEGDYDQFLFKQKIIKTPDFNSKGELKTPKTNINFKNQLKTNKNKYIVNVAIL